MALGFDVYDHRLRRIAGECHGDPAVLATTERDLHRSRAEVESLADALVTIGRLVRSKGLVEGRAADAAIGDFRAQVALADQQVPPLADGVTALHLVRQALDEAADGHAVIRTWFEEQRRLVEGYYRHDTWRALTYVLHLDNAYLVGRAAIEGADQVRSTMGDRLRAAAEVLRGAASPATAPDTSHVINGPREPHRPEPSIELAEPAGSGDYTRLLVEQASGIEPNSLPDRHDSR